MLLNLAIGICGSLIAAWIQSRLKKIRWKRVSKSFLRKTKQATNDFLVHSVIATYAFRRTTSKLASLIAIRLIPDILGGLISALFSPLIIVAIAIWLSAPTPLKFPPPYTEPITEELLARKATYTPRNIIANSLIAKRRSSIG